MADALRVSFGNAPLLYAQSIFTNFSMNGSTDQLETIFDAEPGTVITKLGVRHNSTTGTSPNYKLSLQGVDSTGIPDGTIKGGGSPASVVFSPSSLGWSASTFNWLTLDNPYTVPEDDCVLAHVIAYDSGTVNGSNFSSFSQRASAGRVVSFPYSIQNDAGSRTRSNSGPVIFGYASSSRAYGSPILNFGTHAFNSGTGTADEYGVKFSVPSTWCATYKLLGIRFPGTLAASGSTVLALYGGSDLTAANSTGATTETTSHDSRTFDHDQVASNSGTNMLELLFDDDPRPTLYADAVYRISWQPQNANSVTLLYSSVATASDWDAFDGGQLLSKCLRLNAGNWSSDVATDRIVCELILTDITAPSGGGGGGGLLVNPGMGGRLI